jgi:hypothetical protein
MTNRELFKDKLSLLFEPEVEALIIKCELLEKRLALAENFIKENNALAYIKYMHLVLDIPLPTAEAVVSPTLPKGCTKEWESAAYCGEENKCLKCKVNKK